jgi:hypothetical protein
VAHLQIPAYPTNGVARLLTNLNQIDSTTHTGLYELK